MSVSHEAQQIAHLQRIIGEKDEEIERLRQKVEACERPQFVAPKSWRLSPAEECILCEICARSLSTREQLFGATRALPTVWRDHDADPKTIDVQLWRLRAKLKPLGFEIVTHRGRGWSIEPEQCRAIIAACVPASAPSLSQRAG